MKGLKLLAVVAGTLALLTALLVVVALTPAVQTWAVRKAVSGQPGMNIEIGRVAAGWSEAGLSDIRIEKDGAIITARSASARYSLGDYLSRRRLNADQITVEDLLIDLRQAPALAADGTSSTQPSTAPSGGSTPGAPVPTRPTTPMPDPVPSAPFNGLLNEARLPMDLRVAEFTARGRVLLPADRTGTFDFKATGFETGQRGKLAWTIDFADATPAAALKSLRAVGTADVQIAADLRIVLVEVASTATASGPSLPSDQLKLEARAEQPLAAGNEIYSARLGLVRGGTLEPLVGFKGQFAAATKDISGTWDVALKPESLAALLTAIDLPAISASGSGQFTVRPDTGAISAGGSLQGRIAGLEKISPTLAVVGAVQFATQFDGGLADNTARLEKFELNLTGTDGRQLAGIATLQRVTYGLLEKRAVLTDPKAPLGRVSLQALPLAWLQPFAGPITIESGNLSLALAVEAEDNGNRIRARSLEPLAIRALSLRQGNQKLIEQATLTLRPAIDYTAARVTAELIDFNFALPTGDAITGKFTTEITNLATTPAIAFAVQLQAKIIGALKPYLPLDPGPLNTSMGIEGKLEGDVLQLSKASFAANREGGGLLVGADLQQSITANLQSMTFAVAKPDAVAARLRLGEIPLAWADRFIPKSAFAGTLAGGAFDLSLQSADQMTVTTIEPLTLRGVGVTMDGKPQVQALDVGTELSVTRRVDDVTFEIRRLDLRQGETVLAALNATGSTRLGGATTFSAKGRLEADAGALMAQPALAGTAALARGKVVAVFDAAMADTTQIKVALSGRGFVARQNNQALGDFDLTADANLKADGSGTLALPFTLTNGGRKSDLTIQGTFGRSPTTMLFSGKVSSNQIITDDLQLLAGLAPTQPTSPTTPRAKRDEKPFWQGVNGKVDLDLKHVVYGRDYPIRGLKGSVTITDSRLGLDGLQGQFKENPFKLAAEVKFDGRQPKPYNLGGAVDITNLDLGDILRAANPNERPAIETKVTVVAKLSGNGATLPDLVQGTYGTFDVTGSQGTLRALGRKGQAASTVSSIIGIVGALRGSDTTMALSELTAAMNELKFDSFKMHVERGADLNLKVSALEFISPLMRTTGTGGITAQGKEPIQNQPMRFDLQLGTKDQLALLLNKAGLLSNKQDEKGYYLMTYAFTIGGTAAKPDSSQLWKIIGEAAARAAAGSFLR